MLRSFEPPRSLKKQHEVQDTLKNLAPSPRLDVPEAVSDFTDACIPSSSLWPLQEANLRLKEKVQSTAQKIKHKRNRSAMFYKNVTDDAEADGTSYINNEDGIPVLELYEDPD